VGQHPTKKHLWRGGVPTTKPRQEKKRGNGGARPNPRPPNKTHPRSHNKKKQSQFASRPPMINRNNTKNRLCNNTNKSRQQKSVLVRNKTTTNTSLIRNKKKTSSNEWNTSRVHGRRGRRHHTRPTRRPRDDNPLTANRNTTPRGPHTHKKKRREESNSHKREGPKNTHHPPPSTGKTTTKTKAEARPKRESGAGNNKEKGHGSTNYQRTKGTDWENHSPSAERAHTKNGRTPNQNLIAKPSNRPKKKSPQ